jgi:hypothetical protein
MATSIKKMVLWIMVISMTIAPLRVSVASDEPHCDMSATSNAVSSVKVGVETNVVDMTVLQALNDIDTHACCDSKTSCSTECVVDCATGSSLTALLKQTDIESRFEHVLTMFHVRNNLLSREPSPPIRPPASLTV